MISYSGDTPVENYETWDGSKILIHEATFLGDDVTGIPESNRNKHSRLEEVMKMVSEINVERLILGHFSSRYSKDQIDARIRFLCSEYKIKIPVNRVLPGMIHRDILKEDPINA
jgi:ribonuclease Z